MNREGKMRRSHSLWLILAGWVMTAISLGVGATAGHAAEVLDFTIRQGYLSTRALGMGNAFTAVSADHSAIFYNPAALAWRDSGQLRLFLRAGISDDFFKIANDLSSPQEQPGQDEVDAIFNAIEQNYGRSVYSRLPTLGGMWVRPRWGIAFVPVDLETTLSLHQQVGPQVNVSLYNDTTLAYSYAWPFKLWGDLAIGATAKTIYRLSTSKAVSAADLAQDSSNLASTKDAGEGFTLDFDVGALWQPEIIQMDFMKTTFAAVVRNLLDYGFPLNPHLIAPDSSDANRLVRRLDLGSRFDFPKFWVFEPKAALDFRDIGHPNWSFVKGLHVGAEFFWTMYNWWKGHWSAGLNQGYLTFGLGARFAWFQLDLATWGEEAGTDSAPIESRRFMVEMSLDF